MKLVRACPSSIRYAGMLAETRIGGKWKIIIILNIPIQLDVSSYKMEFVWEVFGNNFRKKNY